MDNETKLSSEQIKSITEDYISKEGGNVDLNEFMNKHLNDKQKEAVKQIVSNPEKLKAILSSPIAQKMINQLSKKDSSKE